MDLSVFPRGKYYAKEANVRFKNPYPPEGREPFALVIERPTKKATDHAMVWDINAFRPDPRDTPEFHQGVKAVVLYESVNYSSGGCHKIPRYIVVGGQKNGKWFTNVR